MWHYGLSVMVEHVAVHVTEVRNGKVALRRFSICQILSLWISKEVNYFFVTKSQKSTADKRIHLLLWIPFKNNWLVPNSRTKIFPALSGDDETVGCCSITSTFLCEVVSFFLVGGAHGFQLLIKQIFCQLYNSWRWFLRENYSARF